MKKFLFSLLFSCFIVLNFNAGAVFSQEVDLDEGAQVFSQNCSACHAGGKNSVNPDKTLQWEDLDHYKKDSVEKIMYQVRNGAGAMPAFDDLTDDEVTNVANFVLNQSKNNLW